MRTIFMVIILSIIIVSCSSKAETTEKKDNSNAVPVRLAAITGDTSLNVISVSGLLSTEDEARLSLRSVE
ncbi:MAG: hypothetical protein HC867_03825 [Bacteroidia bacterium]|nr:hypothetical protein [Bacteroidia bacterium]